MKRRISHVLTVGLSVTALMVACSRSGDVASKLGSASTNPGSGSALPAAESDDCEVFSWTLDECGACCDERHGPSAAPPNEPFEERNERLEEMLQCMDNCFDFFTPKWREDYEDFAKPGEGSGGLPEEEEPYDEDIWDPLEDWPEPDPELEEPFPIPIIA